MGGEGEVRRKRVEVGLVPRIIPPGVSEVGCRLKGSSSLVEWCWGIVGDRMGRKRGRTIVNSTVGSKTNLKYIFVDF